MFKKIILPLVLLASILLSACGTKATPTPAPEPSATLVVITATPDPCAEKNLPDEVAKLHKLTREFDDYAMLAEYTLQAQIVQLIPDMQRILRDAEDRQAPSCLKMLKQLQLTHMSIVVQTLITFMSATDSAGVEKVNTGLSQSRELRNQYDVEMARLLGVTLAALPTLAFIPITPGADATSIAPASGSITVTNASSTSVNLRSAPDATSPQAGSIDPQVTVTAFGKTANGEWIQVEVPGKPGEKAWVHAQLVSISVPISQLPVVNP